MSNKNITHRGASVLGLRLLALLVLVLWLFRLPEIAAGLTSMPLGARALATALWLLLCLPPVVAGLLWFGVRHVADVILPARSLAPRSLHLGNYEWQVIAYSAVALFLLATAVPALPAPLYQLAVTEGLAVAAWLDLIAVSLRLALGAALLFTAPWLAHTIARWRRLGVTTTTK